MFSVRFIIERLWGPECAHGRLAAEAVETSILELADHPIGNTAGLPEPTAYTPARGSAAQPHLDRQPRTPTSDTALTGQKDEGHRGHRAIPGVAGQHPSEDKP